MTSALATTIALVLVSIVALENPFVGITRVHPDAFNQVADTSTSGAGLRANDRPLIIQDLNCFPVPRWYGILNRPLARRGFDSAAEQRPASGGSSGTAPRNPGALRG